MTNTLASISDIAPYALIERVRAEINEQYRPVKKPKIQLMKNGIWRCCLGGDAWINDQWVGYGASPRQAYGNWLLDVRGL